MSLFYFGHLNNRERLCTLGQGTLGGPVALGDRAGGTVLQVFPVCHSLCVCLIALGSGAGAVMWVSPVPPLPSLTKLGTVASCCHFLTGWVWSLILPSKLCRTRSIWTFKHFPSKDTPPGLRRRRQGCPGGQLRLTVGLALQLVLSYPAAIMPIVSQYCFDLDLLFFRLLKSSY